MKFDNEAIRSVKALGSYVKTSAKTVVLKAKIGERKRDAAAIRRMNANQGNTYKDSAGMASGVSKAKVR